MNFDRNTLTDGRGNLSWALLNRINFSERNLQTYRILFAIVTLVIPILVGIYEGTNPASKNYIWDRLFIVAIGATVLGLSYKNMFFRFHMGQIAIFAYYLVTLWMILVVTVNHFSPAYSMGLIAVICASGVGFSTVNRLSIYFLSTISTTTLACWLVPAPDIDRSIYIGSIATIGLISFIALRTKLIIQDHLEISESLMKTIFNESADALILAETIYFRIIECNQRLLELLGLNHKSELLGMPLFNLPGLSNEDGLVRKMDDKLLSSGQWQAELQFKISPDSAFWGDVIVKQMRISSQSCYLVRISDITDKKRAEKKLTWLASFPEKDPVPIIELSLDGRITYINPAGRRQFPEVEVKGLSHPVLFDIYAFVQRFQSENRDGSFREVESSGNYFHQNISLVSNKKLIRVYNIDIGERKRAEHAIIVSEAKNRALINAVPDSMFRINSGGIFLDYKPPINRQTEIYSDEIVAKTIFEVFPNNVALQAKSHLDEALETGRTQIFEYRVTVNGKARDHEARIVRSGPEEALAIVRDITQRKDLDRHLIAAREAAVESSRLRSEFVANVSHEMRTPLHGIMGFTELLLESDITEDEKKHAEIIRSSSGSLLTLINDLLDFSKIEAGTLGLNTVEFDLRDCVRGSVSSLMIRARNRGLNLEFSIPDDVPHELVGDPGRLRQVLNNLIGNAIKFTESGHVKVNLQIEQEINDEVMIHFCVRDSGIGIEPEQKEMIFFAFAQGDGSSTRRYGGTGLGLAITRELVELMGGRIWVESRVGEGSAFHFVASFKKQMRHLGGKRLPEASVLRNAFVLIANKNEAQRKALLNVLSRWQMNPVAVDSAQKVFHVLLSVKHPGRRFSFIIIDPDSFDDDGLTILAEINGQIGNLGAKVVVITPSNWRGDRTKYEKLGVWSFLNMPLRENILIETLLAGYARDYASNQSARRSLKEKYSRFRILIVEDNPETQRLLTDILSERGYTIKTAQNGLDAVNILETNGFELVLMDVQMPVMGGVQATVEIREGTGQNRRTPIIAMTAFATLDDQEQCLRAGMDAYMTKPLDKSELFEVMDKLLKQAATFQATEKSPGLPEPLKEIFYPDDALLMGGN